MIERFDIRQDDDGWTVLDNLTCRPVAILGVQQVGLDIQHALELVDVLYKPAIQEPRSFQEWRPTAGPPAGAWKAAAHTSPSIRSDRRGLHGS